MKHRRQARSLVVEGQRFCWFVTEPRRWMEGALPWPYTLARRRLTLVVRAEQERGSRLLAEVPVYLGSPAREPFAEPLRDGAVALRAPPQQTSVTPALVRRLVELALRGGWHPCAAEPHFVVNRESALRELLDARGERLAALLVLADSLLAPHDPDALLWELLAVGERRIAFEFLCDALGERAPPLPRDALDKLVALGRELGADPAYLRPFVEALARAWSCSASFGGSGPQAPSLAPPTWSKLGFRPLRCPRP